MKKKKILLALLITLMMTTIAIISGCLGESGKFHESYMLYKNEERQITETNYSLILVAVNYYGHISPDDEAAIEIYNNSRYETEIIFTRNHEGSERFQFSESMEIVLEDVPNSNSAKVSIYYI